jgi:hypothetical protein
LKQIASETSGRYFRARDPESLAAIYQAIDFGRQLQIGALYIFKVNNGNIL